MGTRRRLGTALVATVAGAAFLADPAAAQASTTVELIDGLNAQLLQIAIPITLLVEVILVYTVWKFRNNDDPEPTQENRRLEITWTVATAVVLLFVGVASYGVLANPDVTYTDDQPLAPEDDDVVVRAQAFQWGWNMSYPREGLTRVTVDGEPTIVVPKNQSVYIQVTSTDVLHALHVPAMGLKQDAMPGQVNTIRTTPLKQGTYQGYCAEFCGAGHSQMYFQVQVVSQPEYREFVEQRKSEGGDDAAASAEADPEALAGAA